MAWWVWIGDVGVGGEVRNCPVPVAVGLGARHEYRPAPVVKGKTMSLLHFQVNAARRVVHRYKPVSRSHHAPEPTATAATTPTADHRYTRLRDARPRDFLVMTVVSAEGLIAEVPRRRT